MAYGSGYGSMGGSSSGGGGGGAGGYAAQAINLAVKSSHNVQYVDVPTQRMFKPISVESMFCLSNQSKNH